MRRPAVLVDELHRLPIQNTTALRVLGLIDEPDVLLSELSAVIQGDPSLAARVLKLANSAIFGLRGGVAGVDRALVVVGLSTVRTFTLAAAFDLLADRGPSVPAGFGSHAVTTAAGSMAVAQVVGVSGGEAFSAGLLHDLGCALLYRAAPERYQAVCLDAALDGDDLLRAEQAHFGTTHPEAAARALESCGLPGALVEAVLHHHAPGRRRRSGGATLAAVVSAGEALGRTVDGEAADGEELRARLAAVGAPDSAEPRLLAETERIRADILPFVDG